MDNRPDNTYKVKPARQVPWCAVFLVFSAIACHTVTLMGNLDTAEAFVKLGKATEGWSDVGLSLSESLRMEIEIMDTTTHTLTKALVQIGQIDTMIGFVLGASGNITQQAISVLSSGDEEAMREFIQSPMPLTELVLSDSNVVPLVMKPNFVPQGLGPEFRGADSMIKPHKPAVPLTETTSVPPTTTVPLTETTTVPPTETTTNKVKTTTEVPPTSHHTEEEATTKAPTTSHHTKVKDATKGHVKQLVKKLTDAVTRFWQLMKPALVQVGRWLHSMGGKMQGFIEQFSQTIDKAQKIFDQVMSKLAGPADIKKELVFNTFNIFDVTHKGGISSNDVQEVSSLFGITALVGAKGKMLHDRYDEDKDGELSMREYSNFVDDSSLPGCMSYVLRTFAKKLSQIAGQLKGAKMRDEISETVVEYFELMVAKNLTKTKWVSNALTNGSLPVEFSADVFYQLVKQDKAPDKLTDLPVGQTIVGFMVDMNPQYVTKIFKEVADPVFWKKQGFDKKLQAPTVTMVKKWIRGAGSSKVFSVPYRRAPLLLEKEAAVEAAKESYDELLVEIDSVTDEVMERRIQSHQSKLRQERIEHHETIFHADATKVLFKHLLGDVFAKPSSTDTDVEAVTKGGVLALPPTLKFAERLCNNGTATSQRFQKYAFDYAKTSSNPIDNFANQIQAFVKKVEQFLDLTKQYSTPEGIGKLSKKIDHFVDSAAEDAASIVGHLLELKNGDDADGPDQRGHGHTASSKLGSKQDLGVTNVFAVLGDLLDTLKSTLPIAITNLKFAKKEVSAVTSTLKSVFSVFKTKGGQIFDDVANLYKNVWITYYVLFVLLTFPILFYAFFAYGWFQRDTETQLTPHDVQDVWTKCTWKVLDCLQDAQDTNLCFWSCILISEFVILIMFIVSIVFVIIAGVKTFIAFGCAEIYVLGDDTVCTNIMTGLRDWQEPFWSDMSSNINDACEARTLVACKAISDGLMSAAAKTVLGSFAAAFFSFQLLFLSAKLHERARYNHVIEKMDLVDRGIDES